jgi:hypothetical protein
MEYEKLKVNASAPGLPPLSESTRFAEFVWCLLRRVLPHRRQGISRLSLLLCIKHQVPLGSLVDKYDLQEIAMNYEERVASTPTKATWVKDLRSIFGKYRQTYAGNGGFDV